MKKQNQIERKNSRGSSISQGKKPETKRIRVYMPRALKEAIERAAKKLRTTPSRFVEVAIQEELSRIEADIAMRGAAAVIRRCDSLIAQRSKIEKQNKKSAPEVRKHDRRLDPKKQIQIT